MARTHPFKQVDVFTAKPYFGNALAVVLDGKDLSDAQMQRFHGCAGRRPDGAQFCPKSPQVYVRTVQGFDEMPDAVNAGENQPIIGRKILNRSLQ